MGATPKTTVAWCRSCKWYTPAADIGGPCPGDECTYRLTRRVGYICDDCTSIHRTIREMRACEHNVL